MYSSFMKLVMDDRGELWVLEKELLGLIDDLLVFVNLFVNISEYMDVKVEIIIGFFVECLCFYMFLVIIKLVYLMIVLFKVDRVNEFLFVFVFKGGVEVCMGFMRVFVFRGKFDY